jgi:integrase
MRRYPGVRRIDQERYRLRLSWTDPKTGRVHELDRVVTARSLADAAEQRAALKAQALAEARRNAPRPRVGDCARSWLSTKLAEVKPSTSKLYADLLEAHVLPVLGNLYMDTVTRADILAWRDAQVGSPASINSRLRVLRTFFGDVCRDMAIANPTERVKRVLDENTDGDDDRADSKVLTADELVAVLAAVRAHAPQHYALVLTLALTGCRFGEATALRWTDIDENAGVIRIRRAQWRGHVGTTKTRKTRTVALAPELAEELRRHRAIRWSHSLGPVTPWVFTSRTGGFLHSTVLRRPLAAAVAAAELTRTPSAHWFRHTMSDLLRRATTGQVQRSITGHVTEAMSEHYSHVAIEEKREALGRVLQLVRPTPKLAAPEPREANSGDRSGDHPSEPPSSETALAPESIAG